MADRPARRKQQLHRASVLRSERLSPHMTRVVLGGGTLAGPAGFPAGEWTDHYIKLLFPVDGVSYPEPFDITEIRATFPRDQWPRLRTYTVRTWDAAACELTVDFVVHGDEGLAGPWAAAAAPGDELLFLGPGGGYAPDPAAGWHLLAGDESALPAVAAALQRMVTDQVRTPVRVFLEVADERDRQRLPAPENAEVVWLCRGTDRPGAALVPAVRALAFPAGPVQAFVHGEAAMVKELRRFLRVEREVPRDRLSISGYWRTGHDEDGWQASKRAWNEQVEAEQEQGEPLTAGAR